MVQLVAPSHDLCQNHAASFFVFTASAVIPSPHYIASSLNKDATAKLIHFFIITRRLVDRSSL